MIMPWGKYRGEDIDDVPNNYLEWLFDKMVIRNERDRYLYRAIEREIRERDETGFYIEDEY